MQDINKKQLIAIVSLAGVNILLGLFSDTGGRTLEGKDLGAHSAEMRRVIFTAPLISIQGLSFLLGLPLAAILYKGKLYGEKWLTFSLTIAIVLQVLLVGLGIKKLLLY